MSGRGDNQPVALDLSVSSTWYVILRAQFVKDFLRRAGAAGFQVFQSLANPFEDACFGGHVQYALEHFSGSDNGHCRLPIRARPET